MKHLKEIKNWKELINEVSCGDCLEGMKLIDNNSIDTIITDPPYGLSFMGKKWDYDIPSIEIFEDMLRVAKPGATLMCFAGTRTQHRMAVNIEDAGWILKDCMMWMYGSGFPKATDISKQLDKGKREVKGTYKTGYSKSQKESGYRPKEYECKIVDGNPVTDEAKQWNGWKSHGLKPAYEPIIIAMKPNEGSYANNALSWGVSGLNIDGGRIKTNDKLGGGGQKKDTFKGKEGWDRPWRHNEKMVEAKLKRVNEQVAIAEAQGRFPSNVILDEEAAEMLDEQSGEIKTKVGVKMKKDEGYVFGKRKGQKYESQKGLHTTLPGASRFYYIAKADKEERNRTYSKTKNIHPTVKPLKLMEYLCKLTETPTKGIVLDPFMGSWTTALAAKNMGRDFIGFELDEDYCKIGEERLRQEVMF
jgi:DNA modification methylase